MLKLVKRMFCVYARHNNKSEIHLRSHTQIKVSLLLRVKRLISFSEHSMWSLFCYLAGKRKEELRNFANKGKFKGQSQRDKINQDTNTARHQIKIKKRGNYERRN